MTNPLTVRMAVTPETLQRCPMKRPELPPLFKWWTEAKENYSPEEILRFLLNNKEKLEDSLAKMDGKKRLYNAFDRIFSFFSQLAGVADRFSVNTQQYLMRFSCFRGFIERARGWKNHLNFRELIEFIRIKLFNPSAQPSGKDYADQIICRTADNRIVL